MSHQTKILLSDTRAPERKFKAGDRVLVRTSEHLTLAQYKRVERGVWKYAGVEVRVLIVNCAKTTIIRKRWGEPPMVFAGPQHIKQDPLRLGVVSVGCSVVDLQAADVLVVTMAHQTGPQKQALIDRIQRWSGQDVEVILLTTESAL